MGIIVGVVLAVVAAEWVSRDHQRLAAQGIHIGQASARRWGYGVFLFLIVFLPLYLVRRSQALRRAMGGQIHP